MAAKGDLGLVARYLGRYRRDFALATVFAFAEAVLELTIPFQMAYIVDVGIAQAKLDLIYLSGAQMLVTALVAGGCGLGYARASARAAMGFGANLREAEYAHLQGFAFSNLDEFETSSLVTRMTTDVTVVQNALMMGFRPLLRGPIMLVMGLLIACTMSVQLALVFLVTLPVLAVILAIIVLRVAPLYGVMQGAMDRLNEALQEDLVAIRAIKAYVREDYVAARFERVNELLAKSSTRTFRIAVLNTPIFQLSMGVASVCLLWFGGQMIMAGTLGVGTLTGFMSYVLLIMNSLMMISSVFLLLARAITSIHRICEVLRERPALTSAKDGLTSVPDGGVRFCDVSFKYSADAKKDVLEHVSLHFAPGSTVGILGGTGSGKTSLVQLIARLYDASTGVVEVGGRDVRDYDLASLREAVGIVLQKNVLFSEPYYQSGLTIVVKKDNADINGFKDLAGKTVAVQIGTTSAKEVKKNPDIQVKELNSSADTFLELKAGGVQAVVNDRPVNDYYIAKSGEKDVRVVNELLTSEDYGIAMAKDNQELQKKVDEALKKLKENGKYDEIYKKWFGQKAE